HVYTSEMGLKDKIRAIAQKIYRADDVDFSAAASREIKRLEDMGFGTCPICMAKTQYSFSDDQKKLGAPRNFNITVRSVKISAGAGFVVALTGDIMTMPGLPKVPSAEKIDIDAEGNISGIF
ncbi:MAG: formate--tetrahydrofolate ligase, partial [Clostridia bacterium]|nr:formate--tetrahydrofolate ligase [Clostridia bacterium]